jgi:hypothetical protein
MKKRFSISSDYSKNEIFNTLDKLEIRQENGNIINTYYDNNIISASDVSEKYQVFDFSEFARNMVEQVENYFDPEKYVLRIRKGEQELRLIGEEVKINGESYYKMFNILNSTDKSKALQMNIGLLRLVCTNGLVIGKQGAHSNMRVKHFKSSLTPKVSEFEKELEKFNVSIDYQSSLIESLSNKKVSYLEMCKNFLKIDDEDVKDSDIMKLRALGKKLRNSTTDRVEGISNEQLLLLNDPHKYIQSSNQLIDLELNGSQIFNCYTELWRNYDSSVMNRETTRIINLL